MSKSNGDKPALARAATIDPHDGSLVSSAAEGLSKREFVAALALQGLIANEKLATVAAPVWQAEAARQAAAMADALLAALQEA